MDLSFTEEEAAFRAEVRAFLHENLPQELADKVRHGERLVRMDYEAWHATLNSRGWLGSHWPREYGGPGWSTMQKFLFDHECALAWAPRTVPFGVNMLGPVLIKYGTEQQKQHWLPRILDGSDWWCQGYSEPGAGSDLAAISTSAVRDGDEYIVNGQKTWTTLGQYANMIFCLVRTDKQARKQAGISFLLIDMRSPGVEVRPIITLDGEHEVNEVFFTNVRVPAANLVGEENKGWDCAKYLLTYERTNIAGIGLSAAALAELKRYVATRAVRGHHADGSRLFAARLAKVEIELANMQTTNLRMLVAVSAGGVPGAESSMLKIRGTEIRQEIASLLLRARGAQARKVHVPQADAHLPGANAAAAYFNNRKLSIFGGSNEIQRNILAKAILDL